MQATDFSLYPEGASTMAWWVDAGYWYLWAITLFFTAALYLIVFISVVKYRRRSHDEIPRPEAGSIKFEIIVNSFIFAVFLSAFVVGSLIYLRMTTVPADATFEIQVVGKQWMWKFQHPTGGREINELHVPINTKIKLRMTTEDVIHSLFFPAFRAKQDVVPGRYTTQWVEATKEGMYHIFCAEYCGMNHSRMVGRVIVMKQTDYQNWITGVRNQVSPVEAGRERFAQLGCASCHGASGEGVRCPPLVNVYGQPQRLSDGTTVVADESYLRESILNPGAKIVAGYNNIMPTFQGQLDEEQLSQLLTYIKSLAPGQSDAIETTRPARENNPPGGPTTR
jgi:cytochrome c oxidase subunit 2